MLQPWYRDRLKSIPSYRTLESNVALSISKVKWNVTRHFLWWVSKSMIIKSNPGSRSLKNGVKVKNWLVTVGQIHQLGIHGAFENRFAFSTFLVLSRTFKKFFGFNTNDLAMSFGSLTLAWGNDYAEYPVFHDYLAFQLVNYELLTLAFTRCNENNLEKRLMFKLIPYLSTSCHLRDRYSLYRIAYWCLMIDYKLKVIVKLRII